MTKEHCVYKYYLTERDLQSSKSLMKTYVGIILEQYTIIVSLLSRKLHLSG